MTTLRKYGFHYKGTDQRVKVGDEVIVSAKWAKENNVSNRNGKVVRIDGLIVVDVNGFGQVDFDARMITPAIKVT